MRAGRKDTLNRISLGQRGKDGFHENYGTEIFLSLPLPVVVSRSDDAIERVDGKKHFLNAC